MTKIVIIEDNPLNMKLVHFLLSQAGYEIFTASDAEAGLALTSAEMPDLVLMDIQLPGMDGLAATRSIKANANTAHIKVIALTAHAMKDDEATMRAAGCDGYLAKPFHHQTLVDTVRNILSNTDTGLSISDTNHAMENRS